MSKCGKGCMPECEYFTTGGCISPFNCQYKIETGYINSATSIPTYMEKQMSMTAEEIERCLERFTMGKTTDVMNFDYAGTLAYIQRLKSENAALRERLSRAVELPCRVGDKLYEIIEGEVQGKRVENYRIDNMGIWVTVQLKFGTSTILLNEARKIFLTREAAEARLKELGGRR